MLSRVNNNIYTSGNLLKRASKLYTFDPLKISPDIPFKYNNITKFGIIQLNQGLSLLTSAVSVNIRTQVGKPNHTLKNAN